MINNFVYKLIFVALHTWPNGEMARLFERHMEPILYKQELSEEEVNKWAKSFQHSAENIKNRMHQSIINKATYEQ